MADRPSPVTTRRAESADQERVEQFLTGLGLPTAGVGEWIAEFAVAEERGDLIGAAGVERYGTAALLRSVGVIPAFRGTGLAARLVNQLLTEAAGGGVRDVYLLTDGAEGYFPRLGFEQIPRAMVPAAVRQSVEFREACSQSAIVMHRVLAQSGHLSGSAP
jgi:amino-acid N-acetyltransferase